MNTTFIEEQHPRAGTGRFVDKVNDAPTDELAAPAHVNPLARRFDTIEEKVEAMRAELEAGVEALADDAEWRRALDVMARFHTYSFNNQVLISIQRPDASRVAGFNVWKSLGRSVRKGEKGIAILAPRIITARDKDTGEPILNDQGKPQKKVIGFTGATVFDVSQTEGKPLPTVYDHLSEEPPEGYIEDLEAAIRAQGFTVSYEKVTGGALGYTTKHGNRVVIDADLSPGSKATTLAHELGHIACGHMERDDYHVGNGGHRGSMEVEAESFSYVLSQMNGMRTNLRPASEYVASWHRHEADAIREIGDRLQKAVKSTVTGSPFRNAA